MSNRQRTLSLCITIKGPRNRIYIGKDVIRALGFPAFICIKVNEDMSALAIQPGEEKEYMADADLGEFLEQANSRLSENEPRLAHITAIDFYRFCAMGYQACGYDIAEKSPKEQYSRFADGRDDGLSEISRILPKHLPCGIIILNASVVTRGKYAEEATLRILIYMFEKMRRGGICK